jgi:hypothetical protein
MFGVWTNRNRGVRKIGNRQHQRRTLLLDLIELNFELADLLAAGFVRGKNVGRILALPLGSRNLVTRSVLSRLSPSSSGINRRRRASSVATCSSSASG